MVKNAKIKSLQVKRDRAAAKLTVIDTEITEEVMVQLKNWDGPFMNSDWQKTNINRIDGKSTPDYTYYFLNVRNPEFIILTEFLNPIDIKVRTGFWNMLSPEQKRSLEKEIKKKYPHMTQITIQSHFITW